MKRKEDRRVRPKYFWDEKLFEKHRSKFVFRKPILFCLSSNGKVAPVFAGDQPSQGKYTGEKLRQLRAERGVGRPPALIAARRKALLEEMAA